MALRKTAVIKECKKKDLDPGRPMSKQKWCLYTKDGKKLLGRHPSEESARKQEIAIQIHKHGRTAIAINRRYADFADEMLELQNQMAEAESDFSTGLEDALRVYENWMDVGGYELSDYGPYIARMRSRLNAALEDLNRMDAIRGVQERKFQERGERY